MNDIKQKILDSTNNGLSIFEYYIPEVKKYGHIKNFRAVFRNDGNNPDAKVFINSKDHIWCYHDFVSGETLNPFDFVMKHCNCNFKEALEIIQRDILVNAQPGRIKVINQTNAITDFTLLPCDDFNYWYAFAPESAMKEALKRFQVQSLQSYCFKKGAKEYTISAGQNDPVFAFKISNECYKVYRPFAKNNQAKHIWLGKKPENYHDLYGLEQLPEYSELILIVEGLKDTIVSNAHGITTVGVDHASTRIRPQDIEFLKMRCRHLLICYDIDQPGINAANKTSTENGLRCLTLPESLIQEGGKDISDFFQKKHIPEEILTLAEKAKNSLPALEDKNIKENQQRLSKYERVENLISDKFELRFNVVSNEIEFQCNDVADSKFEVLNENNIYRFLQYNNIEFSMAKLTSLLRSDFVKRFNPFINYFEGLREWEAESEPDFILKLCDYLPVRDPERFRIQFCKVFVRTVACALNDTIINKQALIFVQEEQNSGKTTLVRWLCPTALNKYIAENISTDKDSLIALTDNFIINMDELATLSRAEINMLKSMFSKETIKIRRPYDKNATSAPRRASFFGSTNKAEFLSDETGSVRWLCFELTGRINWDYTRDIQIDDIWRQAYSLYKSGFKYELSFDEIRENELANQQYQVTTTEIELIQKNYTPGNKEKHDAFYQATDFLNYLTEKYPNTRMNSNNIGKALKILGFERISKRNDKYPIKGYFINFSQAI